MYALIHKKSWIVDEFHAGVMMFHLKKGLLAYNIELFGRNANTRHGN